MNDHHTVSGASAGITLAESTEPARLPVLQTGGFGASVDAFAWEPDPDVSLAKMRLWLVSLLGLQQAVKALWAHLVKGETATLSTGGGVHFCAAATEGARSWRFFRASLPAAGGYHGLLLPEVALFTAERPDFLLLRRAEDDVASLHYRFINRRVAVPLHPSWADWLWDRALRSGEARALESCGLDAYRCVPDQAALASDLAAAIHRGTLRLADEHIGRPYLSDPSSSRIQEIAHGAT
jgi:hypothetical protein